MTVYIYTPERHAQIVDAYELLYTDTDLNKWDGVAVLLFRAQFAMLKAMQPVKPVAFINPDESYSVVTVQQKATNEFQYSEDFLEGHTLALYTHTKD